MLAYLREKAEDGATDEEVQLALGMNPSTQRPRRIELCRSGHVVDTHRTRSTTSGRLATVWAAVEHRAVAAPAIVEAMAS